MEKADLSQLELFSQPEDSAAGKKYIHNSFFGYVRNYEKVILLIILSIAISVISFSFGIEKGKRQTIAKSSGGQIDIAAKAQTVVQRQAPAGAFKQPELPTGNASPKLEQPQNNEKLQGYTIQVASYQSTEHARREAEILKKNGFAPLVLSKGNYSVLCVGNFSNKELAKSALTKLKKKYRDSFIRRL